MIDYTPFEELVKIEQPEDVIWENIMDTLRNKTFVWAQYLYKEKMIQDLSFYDKERIYLSPDKALENVTYMRFDDQENTVFFLCENNHYAYKIIFEESMQKTNKNDINTSIIENTFVYPEILYFYNKAKTGLTLNRLLKERFSINPRAVFKSYINVIKIELITEAKYNEIQELTSSPYSNQKMCNNMLLQDEITYFYFYHPKLCKLKDIYGFIEYNTNPASIVNIDYRIKKPKM